MKAGAGSPCTVWQLSCVTANGGGGGRGIASSNSRKKPEMEFLDISLTKDLSLLLYAIHSLSTGGFWKKTRLYSGLKIQKKIPQTRKLETIRE
jgi:hypothetical protein